MEKAHIAEFEYDKHEIERALFFLSNALQDSGHNTKPVLLHSIQVAEMLWERGFPQDVVIAAVLHDVVEDTDITIDDVEQSFGHQVAVYVDALTVSDTQDIISLLLARLSLVARLYQSAQQTSFRIVTTITWLRLICKSDSVISLYILWSYLVSYWMKL